MKASDVKTKMKTQQAKSGNNALRDKFRSQKKDLLKRHQEQVDNKDQGNEFPTIFDKSKIPDGIKFWKPAKGDHIIDIIPFFAGSQHPRVTEGELAYVVDLYVHTNVGPLRTPYPCTAKNFKQTDPICEYIAKNRLSKEEWKRVASKRRTAYLVWVHDDDKEEKKGIQIWEVAHFFFEQHIDEIAKSPKGGGATAFSDVETGKSIAFSIKSTGKYQDGDVERESISYSGHRFTDRDNLEIPIHILEQTFSLDEFIFMHPDYEEMESAFFGPPKTKKAVDPDAELDEEQEQEQEEEQEETPVCLECNGLGKTSKGKKCSVCNGTGEFTDTEDDIPSKGQKAPKGPIKKPEPEPQEEETEEEVYEETEEEGMEEESSDDDGGTDLETNDEECPHDPDSFGEVDEHPECEADGGCPLWDLCSDEAGRRKKEEEIKKPLAGKKPIASSNKAAAVAPKRKLGK